MTDKEFIDDALTFTKNYCILCENEITIDHKIHFRYDTVRKKSIALCDACNDKTTLKPPAKVRKITINATIED